MKMKYLILGILLLLQMGGQPGWAQEGRVDADPVGRERVFVADPSAGTWKVVVDAYDVPGGSTTVPYLDVVLNPAHGVVAAADMPQERAPGDRWLARLGRWVAPAAHGADRAPWAGVFIEGERNGERFPVALRPLGVLPAAGELP